MRRTITAILLVVGLFVGAAVWRPVSRLLARQRDYAQAEPLVETIWPMAQVMQRFSDEHGKSPMNLDELAAFSPEHDFARLRRYPHEFYATGPRRFSLRVNNRFAFVIDERFTPTWCTAADVLPGRTNLARPISRR